ncbi:MAG: hypothetical protein IKZ21_02485, partial [Clostridia bacterium]|nr:hypothetical protein [Clostridia bacterium]
MSDPTISLFDFPASTSGTEGDTSRFAAAMAYCREHPGTTLLVPPGEYKITTPLARETMQKALSGELGHNPQDVMFTPHFPYSRGISFAGQQGTTLVGYGATLMVEGFMEPVSVRDCCDVTLKGITIDHLRKPYSWGQVTAVTPREDGFFNLNVTLDAACPVEAGTPVDLRYVLFSPHTNLYFIPEAQSVTVVDSHTLLVVADGDRHPESGESYLGMTFYTLHAFHSRPAILIEQAKNTRLEDVTIHSQPGMGIVGNRSENIWISRLSVIPSAGHHYAVNTDATHFTSITGLLRLEYSNFDGQGDDFINVHNYYHTITPVDDTSCFLHTDAKDGTHAQTLDYPDVGDIL